jgi:hypothetical protein
MYFCTMTSSLVFFNDTPPFSLPLLTDPRTAQTVSEKKLTPYITIFLRKLPILLQNPSLIFILKILIDLKKKQTNIQGLQ